MSRLFSIIMIFLFLGCQLSDEPSNTSYFILSDSLKTETIANNKQLDTNSNTKLVSIDTIHFTITAGQGVNELRLNTALQSTIDIYGKYSNFNQGIACGDHATYYTNRFFFSNNNIVVLSTTTTDNDLAKSQIDEIGVLYPANAITDKGISLRTSNLNKIINVYGEPEREVIYKNNMYLHYYSQGISFSCNKHNNSIEKIAVYKKGRHPDFYYWKDRHH